MEPEFEMAIRVASVVEAFWDGNPPAINRQEEGVEFWDLLPESEIKESLREGRPESVLRSHVQKYLWDEYRKKPRLQRAAKAAGLWMDERSHQYVDCDVPERYVPTRSSDDFCMARRRRFTPPRGKEEFESEVLAELAKSCAELLSHDLHSAYQAITRTNFCRTQPSKERRGLEIISLGRLRHDLASHFYQEPECLLSLIDSLDYLPSFLAAIGTAVLEFSGASDLFRSRQKPAHSSGFQSPIRAWRLQRACDQLGICTAKIYEFEQDDEESSSKVLGRFLASKMLSRIKPNAQPIRLSSILLSSDRWNSLQFEIGRQLLEDDQTVPQQDSEPPGPKVLRVAKFLHVPVPFSITLCEELGEIARSRQVRRQWKRQE